MISGRSAVVDECLSDERKDLRLLHLALLDADASRSVDPVAGVCLVLEYLVVEIQEHRALRDDIEIGVLNAQLLGEPSAL